jgi:type I restriction enzyme S subunit
MSTLWFEKLPKRWEARRLKTQVMNINEKSLPVGQFYIGMENISSWTASYIKTSTETEGECKCFETEDVLFGKLRPYLGKVYLAEKNGVCSSEFLVLRKFNGNSAFLKYIFLNYNLVMFINASTYGAKMPRASWDFIGNCIIPLPPRDEQDQIVRFLDWKVSQINKLINAKRRQVELLREKRRVVIEDVLLSISAPNLLCRYFGSLQNGISESGDFFTAGTPFVSYGDVYQKEILPSAVSGVAKASIKQQKIYSVEKGDIFFTRTSETIDEIGLTSVCIETIPQAVFSGFVIRFRPKKNIIHNHYAKYFFRSKRVRDYFIQEMNLVTRVSLGQTLLKNLPVLLPDMEKQQCVATSLDKQCERIDKIVNKLNDEITLLTEYRTRLISDVVTGKVDVRDVVVLEYEDMVENVVNNEETNDDMEIIQ